MNPSLISTLVLIIIISIVYIGPTKSLNWRRSHAAMIQRHLDDRLESSRISIAMLKVLRQTRNLRHSVIISPLIVRLHRRNSMIRKVHPTYSRISTTKIQEHMRSTTIKEHQETSAATTTSEKIAMNTETSPASSTVSSTPIANEQLVSTTSSPIEISPEPTITMKPFSSVITNAPSTEEGTTQIITTTTVSERPNTLGSNEILTSQPVATTETESSINNEAFTTDTTLSTTLGSLPSSLSTSTEALDSTADKKDTVTTNYLVTQTTHEPSTTSTLNSIDNTSTEIATTLEPSLQPSEPEALVSNSSSFYVENMEPTK